jgi:hypothetical protein
MLYIIKRKLQFQLITDELQGTESFPGNRIFSEKLVVALLIRRPPLPNLHFYCFVLDQQKDNHITVKYLSSNACCLQVVSSAQLFQLQFCTCLFTISRVSSVCPDRVIIFDFITVIMFIEYTNLKLFSLLFFDLLCTFFFSVLYPYYLRNR